MIQSSPLSPSFDTLISLLGDIDQDLIGLALIDRHLRVIRRDRNFSRWLPEPGETCCDCPVLLGMDDALRQLVDGPTSSLALPAVAMTVDGETLKLCISIGWYAASEHFVIASYPDHRQPEAELLLTAERRYRRLADEKLQAIGLSAEIERARYRHIVDAGTDLVLRFTDDRLVTFANKALLGFLGKRDYELIGRPLAEALGSGRPAAGWQEQVCAADKILSFEQEMVTAAGETAWIWWHVSPVGALGLAAEYQAVGRDVTPQRKLRLETERADANAKIAAVTQERLRIARELHDTLIQSSMTALAQIRLARALIDADTASLSKALADAEETTRSAIGEARRAVSDVRLARQESLSEGLRQRMSDLGQRSGIAVAVRAGSEIDALASDAQAAVLRVVDEAIRNIERHSGARHASLTARAEPSKRGGPVVRVEIEDDGQGFDPERSPAGHFGILGMLEHALEAGGVLDIASSPSSGTRLTLAMPMRGA